MSTFTEQRMIEDESGSIRDTLFGDMPLATWAEPGQSGYGEPWVSFGKAKDYLDAGDEERAIAELRTIAETPGLESRHYVQAWHFLRQLGVTPPDGEAKRVYGVVVEVTMNQGLDIVAAYADHTARYFNYSGAAIVWENADNSLDEAIDRVLEAGGSIVHKIGPWEDVRPPAPPTGQVRVSLLTPSGLHFGQGPFNVLASDEMGGPIIAAAMRLMQALMERSKRASA